MNTFNQRTTLTISRHSWHYRVYSWHQRRLPYRENLCHYMRVILIWAPLHAIFGLKIRGWLRSWMLLVPAFFIGVIIWGLLNDFDTTILLLKAIGGTTAIVGAFILVVVLLMLFITWYEDTNTSFIHLVGETVQSWKDKVCPFLDIQD